MNLKSRIKMNAAAMLGVLTLMNCREALASTTITDIPEIQIAAQSTAEIAPPANPGSNPAINSSAGPTPEDSRKSLGIVPSPEELRRSTVTLPSESPIIRCSNQGSRQDFASDPDQFFRTP